MALLPRRKKEMLIGSAPSRLPRSIWAQRLRRVLFLLIVAALFLLAMRHDRFMTQRRTVWMDMDQIVAASRLFRLDFGRCPHDVAELAHPPAGHEPYLSDIPQDPWGRPYTLRCPSRWAEDRVDVRSPGPDGQWLGGDDMSTDL